MMSVNEPACIVPTNDHCGEAVIYCEPEDAVYWTDVNRFLVHRHTLATGETRTWQFNEPCVSLSLTRTAGTLLLGLGSGLFPWKPAQNELGAPIFEFSGWPNIRLNDGRASPVGSFWIGSMANNVKADGAHGACEGFVGELFNIRSGQLAKSCRNAIGISNTVCFSPDGQYFYFGDSKRNTIWRYDYDRDTDTISNETVFFEGYERGGPDGSAIDEEGYVWNCRFGGGCIIRIAPSGEIDRIIDMPVTNITTCDFGGADRKTLFITTASIELDQHELLAGGLFAMRTEVAGAPQHTFTL